MQFLIMDSLYTAAIFQFRFLLTRFTQTFLLPFGLIFFIDTTLYLSRDPSPQRTARTVGPVVGLQVL